MPAIGRIIPYRRAPERPGRLALDFSPEAIRLMGRAAAGGWIEIGRAPLDGEFAARIDALRVEALDRGPGPVPVDIWLPADQVILRRLDLPAGPARRAEALRRIAAETGQAPGALSVAVAESPPGEPAIVLAVRSKIVDDARDYARRWGFHPGRVSTRVEAEMFDEAGPCFQPVRLPALRAGARAALTAAVAACALALAAGAWGLLQDPLAAGALDGELAVVSSTASLQAARIDAGAPVLSRGPFTQISRSGIQSLPARASLGVAADVAVSQVAQGAPPAVGVAPDLASPVTGTPMIIGSSPGLPLHLQPGRLQRSAANLEGTKISSVRHAIGGLIREESRRHALVQTAPSAAALSQPVTAPAAGRLILADSLAPTQPASATLPDLSGGPAPAVEPEIQLAAAGGTAAPRRVTIVPPPRPEKETGAQNEPAEAEAATETTPTVPASAVASVEAPRPQTKPARKAQQARTAAMQDAFGGKRTPRKVRELASQSGLDLDDTSLIGVLDARSGRQALLRTSGGRFMKVGRGDTIDGWRVSTINREAVRLTRGGSSRTLLLVVR